MKLEKLANDFIKQNLEDELLREEQLIPVHYLHESNIGKKMIQNQFIYDIMKSENIIDSDFHERNAIKNKFMLGLHYPKIFFVSMAFICMILISLFLIQVCISFRKFNKKKHCDETLKVI